MVLFIGTLHRGQSGKSEKNKSLKQKDINSEMKC